MEPHEQYCGNSQLFTKVEVNSHYSLFTCVVNIINNNVMDTAGKSSLKLEEFLYCRMGSS